MKNVLFFVGVILLLAACEKESVSPTISETGPSVEFRSPKDKIDVCHYSEEDNSWHLISISLNAWKAHAAHGDVRLDDQDEDGYVPENECDFGLEGDCDDNNEFVNPGAEENCEDGIDNDCDGAIDADDDDCVAACIYPEELYGTWSGPLGWPYVFESISFTFDCSSLIFETSSFCPPISMRLVSVDDGVYRVQDDLTSGGCIFRSVYSLELLEDGRLRFTDAGYPNLVRYLTKE